MKKWAVTIQENNDGPLGTLLTVGEDEDAARKSLEYLTSSGRYMIYKIKEIKDEKVERSD